MKLQTSSTSRLRSLLVALFATACLAATPDRYTKIPVDDSDSVKQLRDSIAELTKRLEKTPNDIPARIELAGGYTQLAEFDSAERELATATANAPNNAQAWAAFGSLKGVRQQWQQAIEPLQKAIALGDKEGDTFLFLGTAYQNTEDRTKAFENYAKAIEHGCNAALLSRGWLHYRMGNANLAIADFDKAIELKFELANTYRARGNVYRSLQDATKALADYSNAIEAEPKSSAAYDARARLRYEVLGDFTGAIDDFTHAIEFSPTFPAAYAARGTAYIAHRDYEKGLADINEAIRLNPNDLGQSFELATDKVLDPAALHHGEEQLRKMLADRPRMAEHIERGDKLWTWAVRKFAGEDLGTPIDWDPGSPDPFASRSGPAINGEHGGIQVNLLRAADQEANQAQTDRPQQTFEMLWVCAVYELYNVTSSSDWDRIQSESDSGKLSRDEYIQTMMRSERNAGQRTRAFYVKFFLPWLRSKNLDITYPNDWFCEDFGDVDTLRSDYAFRGNSTYLSFYENTYDIRAAYLEEQRGNYQAAKDILARVLDHPDGLDESQRFYARGLLSWVKQTTGDAAGAIKELTATLNELTSSPDDDAKRFQTLYVRSRAYNIAGRQQEAIADLNTAIDLDPKAPEPRVARATFFTYAAKYADAKRDLDTALTTDPELRPALHLRGYVEFYRQEYAQAVDDLTKAFDPQDAELLGMRGNSYEALHDYEKAYADFDALVRLQPTDANAYASRGGVLQFLKQNQKALADYDRATELDPKLIAPYINRSELLSETDDPNLRRPAQAMKDARRGCELSNWKEPEALRALASAYAATGDFANAIKWQEKALKTGDADHREEYTQLLASYRKQVATTPPATSTQTRPCSACASQCCSQLRSICHRRCGVFGAFRLFRR